MKKVFFVAGIIILSLVIICGGCGESTTETATKTETATSVQTETATATQTETATVTTTTPVKTKILKFSLPLPEGDPMVNSAQQWADDFNARAGGLYEIEIFAGGVLGGMVEVFDMVRAGAIEMSDFDPAFISGKDYIFGPQVLPFVTKDAQACIKFYELIKEQLWQERLEATYNVHMLSLSRTASHDWNGTKPIYTLDDWKGTTICVSGPVEAASLEALGASTVTLDWNDIYTSIEKNVVDGSIYGIFPVWMAKWEACKYVTEANMFSSASAVIINADVYNEMPAEIQQIFNEGAIAHQDRLSTYFYEIMDTAIAEIEAAGTEVYTLPADERAKWEEVTKAVIDDYYSQLDPADAALIKSLLAEANQ